MKRRIDLLPREGIFYKANLHCCSTLSDGRLTPKQLKELYKGQGYQILAITDQGMYRDHRYLEEEGFLVIPSTKLRLLEKNPKDPSAKERIWSFTLWDGRPDSGRVEKEKRLKAARSFADLSEINDFLGQLKQMGFLICYNHPYGSLHTYRDYRGLRGLFAMEIYHHRYQQRSLCGYSPQAYDELLRLGNRLFCIAADGNHNDFGTDDVRSDSFGGFVMVKAKELTFPAVMEALQKGEFYSSMGPEIRELYLEGNELVVRSSPVERIYVITDSIRCYCQSAMPEEELTEARFTLDGKEGYLHVKLCGRDGKCADSNAYFLKEAVRGQSKEESK